MMRRRKKNDTFVFAPMGAEKKQQQQHLPFFGSNQFIGEKRGLGVTLLCHAVVVVVVLPLGNNRFATEGLEQPGRVALRVHGVSPFWS